MRLTIRDIGKDRYITMLRRRLAPLQNVSNQQNNSQFASTTTKKAPRFLRQMWTKNTDLNEEEAAEVSDYIWQGPQGAVARSFAVVMPIVMLFPLIIILSVSSRSGSILPALFPLLMFPFIFAIPVLAMLFTPGQQIKAAAAKELTTEEIEGLLPQAKGRLERQYFGLVLDALRTEIPSMSAQSDIQAALRHLGDAISRLPADPIAVPDAEALRREAQSLRQEAAREADAFVCSSLNRQAEVLEQRATLTVQNGRAARRAAALRREARIQMDSLRSVLVGFQQAPQLDTGSISQLSAALHRVAGEAKSVALARQELDNEELERLYGHPLPVEQAVPVPAVTAQTVQGMVPSSTPPVSAPANPGGSTRPWWRNNNNSNNSNNSNS